MWLSINGPRPRLAAAFALALGVGCGQVSNDPNGIASRPSTRAGAGGEAAGSSRAGAGGEEEGGRGGAPAMSADAGGLEDNGGSSGTSQVGGDPPLPDDCPEIDPIPAPGQVIVIQSVNFDTSEVVLKNVSDETQVILGGRQGWQWCQFPAYWTIYEAADVELSPGETFAFTLIYGTTLRPLDPDGGELGIYNTTGSFTTANLMRAFVS